MVDDDDDNRSRRAGADADEPAPGDRGPRARDTGAGGSAGARPRTRRRRRPIWRRGWFWVGVIALEVVLALAVSFAYERSTTEVDLAGGDLDAFCDLAWSLREEQEAAVAAGGSSSAEDPNRFRVERDAYQALIPTAPDDLVPDLERLVQLYDEILVVVEDVAARRAADPSVSGLTEINRAVESAQHQGRVAAARVDLVLREQCEIMRGATTTQPGVPGVSGTLPGGRPVTSDPTVPGGEGTVP